LVSNHHLWIAYFNQIPFVGQGHRINPQVLFLIENRVHVNQFASVLHFHEFVLDQLQLSLVLLHLQHISASVCVSLSFNRFVYFFEKVFELLEIQLIQRKCILLVKQSFLLKKVRDDVNELFWTVNIGLDLLFHKACNVGPLIQFQVFRIGKVGN